MVLQILTSPRFLRVVLAVGALGFIVSHPALLGWLGKQTPIYVFALWYVVFFGFITTIGLTLLPGRFRLRHAIGLLVLWLGLSPVLGWMDNTELTQKVTGVMITGVESGPEESIISAFWSLFTGDVGTLIALTYVLTPMLLVTLAIIILTPEPFFKLFRRVVHL